MFAGGLNFGLTDVDPSKMKTDRLLEKLRDNRDFQVTFENVGKNKNDILIFWITKNGTIVIHLYLFLL